MRIELVHVRDPEGSCEMQVFVDGVPAGKAGVEVAEFTVDAGAGCTAEEWHEATEHDCAVASPAVAEVLRRYRSDPPGKDCIDGWEDGPVCRFCGKPAGFDYHLAGLDDSVVCTGCWDERLR
ncbi:MAG TPA: hypothetical protein VKV25_01935 [Acidimicrobiales bacterium]|nr:hypothetical protein [Acidimicrobiales bacterium]